MFQKIFFVLLVRNVKYRRFDSYAAILFTEDDGYIAI